MEQTLEKKIEEILDQHLTEKRIPGVDMRVLNKPAAFKALAIFIEDRDKAWRLNELSEAVYNSVNEVNAERAKLILENYKLNKRVKELEAELENIYRQS